MKPSSGNIRDLAVKAVNFISQLALYSDLTDADKNLLASRIMVLKPTQKNGTTKIGIQVTIDVPIDNNIANPALTIDDYYEYELSVHSKVNNMLKDTLNPKQKANPTTPGYETFVDDVIEFQMRPLYDAQFSERVELDNFNDDYGEPESVDRGIFITLLQDDINPDNWVYMETLPLQGRAEGKAANNGKTQFNEGDYRLFVYENLNTFERKQTALSEIIERVDKQANAFGHEIENRSVMFEKLYQHPMLCQHLDPDHVAALRLRNIDVALMSSMMHALTRPPGEIDVDLSSCKNADKIANMSFEIDSADMRKTQLIIHLQDGSMERYAYGQILGDAATYLHGMQPEMNVLLVTATGQQFTAGKVTIKCHHTPPNLKAGKSESLPLPRI